MTSKLLSVSFILAALTFSITFSFQSDQQKVLLISFDGFRWDYLYRVPTPHFHYIMKHGVHVKQVTNIFITKTYPNHYTLVTGLFAENHGIVANDMFDPVLNKTFSLEHMDIYESEFWEEATPIWITNQRAGYTSGAAMWPGTDVQIHKTFPTHYMPYNESVSFEDRVAKIIEWFTSEEPINLGLLYWENPDDMGHELGPDSPLMDPVISDIDKKLGYLIKMLKRAKLWNNLNLIITSDHGMTQCSDERIIEFDQYLERDHYTLIDQSPVVAILPKEGKFDEVYEALAHAHPNLTVYKKEEILERWHYRHNSRIQPILAVADEGWYILQNKSDGFMLGNHGYDNALAKMHPIFLAQGPAFRKNFTKEAMNSTDLYPLLCHLLNLTAQPHNGSFRSVQDMLSSPAPRENSYTQSTTLLRGSGTISQAVHRRSKVIFTDDIQGTLENIQLLAMDSSIHAVAGIKSCIQTFDPLPALSLFLRYSLTDGDNIKRILELGGGAIRNHVAPLLRVPAKPQMKQLLLEVRSRYLNEIL